jgi:acyl dehydratase
VRYLEDFNPGQVFELGSRTVTREEILDFARKFDPQPFHVDEEAARRTPFGGLIASGWHTTAIYMRLYADAVLSDSASLGSPGVEQIRWLAPVRPGDTLHGRLEIVDVRASERDPGRGTVLLASELRNQDGRVVLSFRGRGLFERRAAGEAAAG